MRNVKAQKYISKQLHMMCPEKTVAMFLFVIQDNK